MLAMDDFGNGHPVAFCVTEKDDAGTLAPMLADFLTAVRAVRSDWWPSCFLVDDDAAEHNAVRYASCKPAKLSSLVNPCECLPQADNVLACVRCEDTLLPVAG